MFSSGWNYSPKNIQKPFKEQPYRLWCQNLVTSWQFFWGTNKKTPCIRLMTRKYLDKGKPLYYSSASECDKRYKMFYVFFSWVQTTAWWWSIVDCLPRTGTFPIEPPRPRVLRRRYPRPAQKINNSHCPWCLLCMWHNLENKCKFNS